jgi:predicted NACHT family NTPase
MSERAKRSHSATSEGLAKAKEKLRKFESKTAFADVVGVSRATVQNFFAGKPINQANFKAICDELGLSWEEIAGLEDKEPRSERSIENSEIERLVKEVREKIRSLIKERCGKMRVLDMTQPIELTGEQGIYTKVNILEKITARNRMEIVQLVQNADLEEFEFDRFGLSCVAQERVAGIEAVKQHNKLMVLGKPGAGKTTFLKYLAMQCIEGHFLGDRVPLFITLKDFAETKNQPGFLDYIQEKITNNATQSQFQDVIQQGKAFVLLDGLDEVREEDTGRVLRGIRDFSNRYAENHFVITCRIAAKEYVFERFTEVEVADFDDEQISTFIHNWFRCKKPGKGEEFAKQIIEKLDKNKPIKELASNPLLLTLLCLECEESLEFPKNRAELYERGLKVLLSKWDASREIQRDQFYEKLSINRKEDLLSQLALKTFEQKDYFFKQRTVEHHIADYIINLPDARTDPKALQLDSEAALKSIEAQHGLLVERARGIYSFSHLTFQEYFTAKQIVNEADYARLVEHLTEKRWREVFLLAANIMPKADRLLLLMKQAIDSLLLKDGFQEFLKWFSKKYALIQSICKTEQSLVAIRALLFDILLNDFQLQLLLTVGKDGDTQFDFSLELPISEMFGIDERLPNIFGLSVTYEIELPDFFKEIVNELNIGNKRDDIDSLMRWYHDNYQEWKISLREYQASNIVNYIGDEQKILLQQYYDANKLLVDCLNSDCYVSRDVRQDIKETLFLPMAEIEKRTKDQR